MRTAETPTTQPAGDLTDEEILAELRSALAEACPFVLAGAMPRSLEEARRVDRARTLLAELVSRRG